MNELKVLYQNRDGVYGDLPQVPMIRMATRKIEELSQISIGDIVGITYLPNRIVITKLRESK